MIIKGVTYVSRQVSTMCLCQTNPSTLPSASPLAGRVDSSAVHAFNQLMRRPLIRPRAAAPLPR